MLTMPKPVGDVLLEDGVTTGTEVGFLPLTMSCQYMRKCVSFSLPIPIRVLSMVFAKLGWLDFAAVEEERRRKKKRMRKWEVKIGRVFGSGAAMAGVDEN